MSDPLLSTKAASRLSNAPGSHPVDMPKICGLPRTSDRSISICALRSTTPCWRSDCIATSAEWTSPMGRSNSPSALDAICFATIRPVSDARSRAARSISTPVVADPRQTKTATAMAPRMLIIVAKDRNARIFPAMSCFVGDGLGPDCIIFGSSCSKWTSDKARRRRADIRRHRQGTRGLVFKRDLASKARGPSVTRTQPQKASSDTTRTARTGHAAAYANCAQRAPRLPCF